MLKIQSFTFNPFQENTYILYNDQKECVIIDPGMYTASEQIQLDAFIKENQLKPIQLINTHCHIDHIFGNNYCVNKYQLELFIHKNEIPVLESGLQTAKMYGLNYDESPMATQFIDESNVIKIGNETLSIIFTPGHSPGSLSFYSQSNQFVIVGDALFFQSIGRTDLPGGDYDTLIESIQNQLMVLPNETKVYSGHGSETTIGHEKLYNPFLN
ncbi:MAG: MBL fold metallo-hydrolase [Bacteroidota bacterium]|nr:MBL fold metallo-hydrolase [Bacteroidota bacterium]